MTAFALSAAGAIAVFPFTTEMSYAQGNSNGKGEGASSSGNRGGNKGNDNQSSAARSNSAGSNGGSAPGNSSASEAGGRGALASELGALNAAHASPQALANASPDSMPGKLAAYKDGYLETSVALGELNEAQADLNTYVTEQMELWAAANPDYTQEEYDAALAELQTSTEYLALESDLTAAQETYDTEYAEYSTAYNELTGGVALSAEAVAELNAMLGL